MFSLGSAGAESLGAPNIVRRKNFVWFCLTVAILSFFIRFQPLEAIACGFLLLMCREARVLLKFNLFSSLLTLEAIFLWLSPRCV